MTDRPCTALRPLRSHLRLLAPATFALVTLAASPEAHAVTQKQYNALIKLYQSTGGDNWSTNTNWLKGYAPNGPNDYNSPCTQEWHGVTCNNANPPFITELSLSYKNLTGQIPPELGDLDSLTSLSLAGNKLTIQFPPELGNLDSLTSLNLSDNQITAIPPELGNLDSLTSLWLSYNQIAAIPPELGNLDTLTELHIYFNLLTAIPPELGNLDSLTSLNLQNNLLTAIPPELGNLDSLTSLLLLNNQITAIPPELGNLDKLSELSLSNNLLTAIPPELGNLDNLTRLSLCNNLLTAIPPELGNLDNLTSLGLCNNLLTAIPPELGNLDTLTGLYLYNNRLTAIPPELGPLEKRTRLYLSSNQLTGDLTTFLTEPLRTQLLANGEDFHYQWNGLHADPELTAQLEARFSDPDELFDITTQTLAPQNLQLTGASETYLAFTWAPRDTSPSRPGGYHIYLSTDNGQTYDPEPALVISGKGANQAFLQPLEPGTSYTIRIESFTSTHDGDVNSGADPNVWWNQNHNTVISSGSPAGDNIMTAKTLGDPPTDSTSTTESADASTTDAIATTSNSSDSTSEDDPTTGEPTTGDPTESAPSAATTTMDSSGSSTSDTEDSSSGCGCATTPTIPISNVLFSALFLFPILRRRSRHTSRRSSSV